MSGPGNAATPANRSPHIPPCEALGSSVTSGAVAGQPAGTPRGHRPGGGGGGGDAGGLGQPPHPPKLREPPPPRRGRGCARQLQLRRVMILPS